MKLYLAARWANRIKLHPHRDYIQALGHEVTSGWLDEINDAPRDAAARDLLDIRRADAIVLWPDIVYPIISPYGGMFVEFGYALALGKKLLVVEGHTSPSVFLQLPKVTHFSSWDSLYRWLAAGEVATEPAARGQAPLAAPQVQIDRAPEAAI